MITSPKPFFTYTFIMNNEIKESCFCHRHPACFRNMKGKRTNDLRKVRGLWGVPVMKAYLFFY